MNRKREKQLFGILLTIAIKRLNLKWLVLKHAVFIIEAGEDQKGDQPSHVRLEQGFPNTIEILQKKIFFARIFQEVRTFFTTLKILGYCNNNLAANLNLKFFSKIKLKVNIY